MRTLTALALALSTSTALAQPKTKKPDASANADKGDARALLASGLKLYAAKDYLGALAIFKNAYERFPSPKILLNIGTTLKALDRNAEAANVYQRYLDAPESEAGKKADVAKVLAELDAKVGTLLLTVTPSDAEVQVNAEDWQPASAVANYRVAPGTVTIRARKEGFEPGELTYSDATAGKARTLSLNLKPIVVAVVEPVPPIDNGGEIDERIEAPVARKPSRFGAFAIAHVDIQFQGGAARVGGSFEVIPRLQVEAGALLGPSSGGYVGARYAFLPGKLRPVLVGGMPIFVSDGPRLGVRAAGGLEVVLHRHLSIVAEVGVERMLNPEMNIADTLFVPAIGAAGRL